MKKVTLVHHIAIPTLNNGPAFGGIRYFDYKDNKKPIMMYKNLQKQ